MRSPRPAPVRRALATLALLVLFALQTLARVDADQPRAIDVARDDHKTARRLLYSSGKDDAERLKQLREAVRLLESAQTIAGKVKDGGDECELLRGAIAEDLASARKKLAPLEPPAPAPGSAAADPAAGGPRPSSPSPPAPGSRTGSPAPAAKPFPQNLLDSPEMLAVVFLAFVFGAWLFRR